MPGGGLAWPAQRDSGPGRPGLALQLTSLESRVLYSAAPLDLAVAAGEAAEPVAPEAWADLFAALPDDAPNRSLIVVDGSLAGAEQLAAELAAGQPAAEVMLLDPAGDGLARLESLLSGYHDLQRIELFSHGDRSGLSLGDEQFGFGEGAWLRRLADAVDGALVEGGDLLLHGCDLAANQSGRDALSWLATSASIDVAASSDLTGSAAAGGDWDLEYRTGVVLESGHADPEAWTGVLLTGATPIGNLLTDETTEARDRGSTRAVAMHSDGSFVVVFASDLNLGAGYTVQASCYNAAGVLQGLPITVSQHLAKDQEWASVDMDAAGRFVVTWTSDDQDGDNTGVYARLFSAAGVALGNEFLVNTDTTSGHQQNSTVTMADDGSFVVVWEGKGPGDKDGIFGQRFDAAGVALGGNFIINDDTGKAQHDAAVSVNDNGAFVVSWDSNDGFLLQRFDAAGNRLGGEITVAAGGSAGNGTVLLNNDGSIVAAWRDTAGGPDEALYRIYGPANEIRLGPTVIAAMTAGDQTNPSITGDGSGSFTISWDGENASDSEGVLVRQFFADGTPAGTEILANSYTSGFQGFSSVAVNETGDLVVVWSGESALDGQGVYFALGGAPTGNNTTLAGTEDIFRVLQLANFGYSDPEGTPMASVRITAVNAGTLMLGQSQVVAGQVILAAQISAGELRYLPPAHASGSVGDAIRFRVSDGTLESATENRIGFNLASVADGATIGLGNSLAVLLPGTTANSTLLGDQTSQHLAALTSGGFVVVWQSTDGYLADGDDGTQIVLQLYDEDGLRVGGEVVVEPGAASDQFRPRVAGLEDGGFVVVWETSGAAPDIYAQRFDASGNKLNADGSNGGSPAPFLVCQHTTGTQLEADIVALPGGFAIAWASSDPAAVSGSALGIVARFFGLDGSASAELQVNTFDTGAQRFVRLAALNNGQLLVTWVNQNGDSYDIQGSIVSRNASAPSSEFTINTTTALRQLQQSVAALGDDGFVVTWQSESGDGSSWGIKARRFDLNGNPVDANELAVNLLTDGPQQSPKVVGLADGSFTVFWNTWGVDADGQGIASRRFAAASGGFGPEAAVNQSVAGHQVGAEAVLLASQRIATVWETANRHGLHAEFGRDVVVSLLANGVNGTEDLTIPLQLAIGQLDASEALTSVQLFGLTTGTTLTDGTNSHTSPGAGFVDITAWNLANLSLVLPVHNRETQNLRVQVESSDGISVRSSGAQLVVKVNGVNDLPSIAGHTATTGSHQSVNIAASTVFSPLADPDHATATAPAVTPLMEFVADPDNPPATNVGGDLVWQPTGGGPSITLPGTTTFGPAAGTAIGDIDATLGLAGGSAGLLDLTSLTGNQNAIELWIRPDSLLQSGLIFEWGSSNEGVAIYQTQGSIRVDLVTKQDVLGFAVPTLELVAGGLRAGEFNQVVLVLDGDGNGLGQPGLGDVSLYLNGQLLDAAVDIAGIDQLTVGSILANTGAASLIAGAGGVDGSAASTILTAGAPGFAGQLARLAVFDQALDEAEVQNRFIAIQNSAGLVSIAGTPVTGPATVTLASGALLEWLPDGSFSYDPNGQFDYLPLGQSANDVFTYEIADQTGLTTTVQVTVTVTKQVNTAPGASNDSFATGENALLGASVAGNDGDIDLQALTWTLVSGPASGSFSFQPDGSFTFDPGTDFDFLRPGQSATASFTYRVTDALGATDTAVVTITVNGVNDQPVLAVNTALTVFEGAVGAVLTPAMLLGADPDDSAGELTYVVTSLPANGTLRLNGVALTLAGTFSQQDIQLGLVTYDHDGSETLSDSIGLSLRDGGEDGAAAAPVVFSIVVIPVSDQPIGPVSDLDPAANQVAENSAAGTLTGLVAGAVDLDGEAISWSLDDDAGGLFAINAATGAVSVAAGATGLDFEAGATRSVTVRATSTDGSFSTRSFVITLQDVDEFDVTTPVDGDGNPNEVDENAAGGSPTGITATASDLDGTGNTVTWSLADNAGGRFRINPHTGVVTVAPGASLLDAETTSSHTIVVRATSADGSSSTASFVIAVADVDEFDVDAITDLDGAANEIAENAAVGSTVGLTAFARDLDATHHAIAWSLDDDAGGRFAIDPASGLVRLAGPVDFEQSDSHLVTIRASSADGSSSVRSLKIRVVDVADTPPLPPPKADVPVQAPASNNSGSEIPVADTPLPGPVEGPPPPGDENELPPEAVGAPVGRGNSSADTANRESRLADFGEIAAPSSFSPNETFASGPSASAKALALDYQLKTYTSRKVAGLTEYGPAAGHDWFARFMRALDDHREGVLEVRLENESIVSTAAGLIAVGYLTWIVKGSGALLSAFVSSLPAWQSFDPLLVIEASGRRDDDDESIEEMVDHEQDSGNPT